MQRGSAKAEQNVGPVSLFSLSGLFAFGLGYWRVSFQM